MQPFYWFTDMEQDTLLSNDTFDDEETNYSDVQIIGQPKIQVPI